MRARLKPTADCPRPSDLIVSARPDHTPILGYPGPGSRYSFGPPKVSVCRARRGSHAGLQQITVAIYDGDVVAAEINVHLHHNSRGLSVGSTVRHLHRPEKANK